MAIVTFYDINEETVSTWARKNCPSFVCWLVYESTDLDETWLLRYEFEFTDNHDAMLFQLRWQGQ
jgi:hypothetical protein